MSSRSPRRPSQPGSTNALVHDHFSQMLRLATSADEDGILLDLIHSDASCSGEVPDFDARLAVMRGIGCALVSFARFLRSLETNSRDGRSAITALLNIALDELGMGSPNDSPAPIHHLNCSELFFLKNKSGRHRRLCRRCLSCRQQPTFVPRKSFLLETNPSLPRRDHPDRIPCLNPPLLPFSIPLNYRPVTPARVLRLMLPKL